MHISGDTSRRIFLILCGAALFVAGALYLHLDRKHVERAWLVTGGPGGVVSGGGLALRVGGRLLDERADVRVDVRRIRVAKGGAETAIDEVSIAGGRPATVIVPSRALDGAEEVVLDVDGPAGQRTLRIPVDPERVGAAPLPEVQAGDVQGEGGLHRVEVLPEGGVLVAGARVDLLVRGTDAEGHPLAGARVELKLGNQDPVDCRLDGAGLCRVAGGKASSRQAGTVRVVDASGGETSHSVTLDPATVKTALSPAAVLVGEGGAARLALRSFYDEELVYCDLWGDGAAIWAETLLLDQGAADVAVEAPGDGAWRLQCAYHPAMPGGAWATALLIRGGEGTRDLRAHVGAGDGALRPWIEALPDDGALGADGDALLVSFLGSRLRFEPQAAVVLLDTRILDEAALVAEVTSTRRTLLMVIGGIFAVMVAWMVLSVLFGYRSVRKGFDAFQREQGEGAADSDAPLQGMSRSQAIVQVVALMLIIVLNVVAIVLLLKMLA